MTVSVEHLRLYQHVHLDHGYDHRSRPPAARWPVDGDDLVWAHETEHRIGHFRFCDPHLLDDVPEHNLDAALALEPVGTVGS